MDGTDDAEVYPRPEASRVLRRALALSSVAVRSFAESGDRADSEEMLAKMRRWLRETGIEDELEPQERAVVATPLGQLDLKLAVNGSWRSEGLYVLAWALGRYPTLAHDETVDPERAAKALGFLEDDALSSEKRPRLRSDDELDAFDSRQLALHWRFRDYSLRPAAMDFAKFVRECGWAALSVDASVLIDNDLSVGGMRIDKAEPAQVQRCLSIAMERHQAINWLRGEHPIYSEVDTST